MPCYSPVPAWPDLQTGRFVYSYSSTRELGARIETRCRQCLGCRLDHSQQHSLRCMHEAHGADAAAFVTLTNDDAHFPTSQAEWEHEVRLFVKRLRKASPPGLRTFGCLELGESTRRPHAHLLVFHRDFSRAEPIAKGEAGSIVYRSDELDALWLGGHASVGELTEQSASYVARYSMARRSVNDALGEFEAVSHPLTGQLIQLRPAMPIARSQGLGLDWFKRYGEQVMHQGAVILQGGVRVPIPDYYLRQAKTLFPGVGADAEAVALERLAATAHDRTPERLAVREVVKVAQLRGLKRGAL